MIKHTVRVKASTEYDVLIGGELLCHTGELILQVHKACECVLVSDDTVYSLYGKAVTASLETSGFSVKEFVFPHGERSKSVDTLLKALEAFNASGLTRSGLVVALGGGVTGDLAGFAASVYLRGVPFVQIPTTLLAAIDSSVGGKTAVNASFGKNLVGSFHQPIRVICDTDTFATLPEQIFCDGMAEAIKYGALEGADLFDAIADKSIDTDRLVAECVSIKARIVENDERDTGMRALLNLGHTAAHSIETLSDYTVSHGQAVAIGMRIIAAACDRLGMSRGLEARMRTALKSYGLDAPCTFSASELAEVAKNDKKRKGSKVTVVMLEDIGKPFPHTVDINALSDILIP